MALERWGDGPGSSGGRGEFRGRSGGNQPPSRPLFDRLPPQNIEAEQAVLGAMMLGDRGAVEKAQEILRREDFYREAHAHVFDAMLALTEKDEPIDAITLKDELVRKGQYEAIGGAAYLMALMDVTFTTANIGYYAKIVQEKGLLRRLIEAASQISGLAYGDVDDVDVVVDQAERTIFEVSAKRTTQFFFPLRPLLNEAFEKIDTLYHEKGITTGIDTGYNDLNYITSGLQDGDLVIIAARPSMGKTSLALGIGQNAALRGGKQIAETGQVERLSVAVFSLEMSKEQLVQRMICSEAKVDAHRLRTGYLHDEDWTRIAEAVQRLWDANLFIDDSTDLSALEMRAKCRRLRAEHGLDLVIVDYLQLMRAHRQTGANRNEEITEIARGLKQLAREMRVPVIALAQLSRAVERREDKRPMLSDLRDSGSIEAEADVVGFIYRPAYYERKEAVSAQKEETSDRQRSALPSSNRSRGAVTGSTYTGDDNLPAPVQPEDVPWSGEYGGEEAEIIIAKQRNGPTGTVKLSFMPKFARFDNLAVGFDEVNALS